MFSIVMFITVIAAVVAGLTELLKRTDLVPTKFLPILVLVVGVAVGLAATPFTDLNWEFRAWIGGLAGLSAMGVYDIAALSALFKKDNDSK